MDQKDAEKHFVGDEAVWSKIKLLTNSPRGDRPRLREADGLLLEHLQKNMEVLVSLEGGQISANTQGLASVVTPYAWAG